MIDIASPVHWIGFIGMPFILDLIEANARQCGS
jgi:hypothetical protein